MEMVLEHEQTDWTQSGGGYTVEVYRLRERAGGPVVTREQSSEFAELLGSDAWQAALHDALPAESEQDIWAFVEGHRGRGDFTLKLKVRCRSRGVPGTPGGDPPRVVSLPGE